MVPLPHDQLHGERVAVQTAVAPHQWDAAVAMLPRMAGLMAWVAAVTWVGRHLGAWQVGARDWAVRLAQTDYLVSAVSAVLAVPLVATAARHVDLAVVAHRE